MVNADSFLKPITEGIKNAFTVKLKEIVVKPLEEFGDFFEDLLNDLKNGILKAFSVITIPIKYISKAVSAIGQIFQNLAKKLIGTFKPIIKMFSNMFRQIGKMFVSIFSKIASFFSSMAKKFMSLVRVIGKFLMKIFKTIGEFFKNLFEQISKVFELIFFYIICTWNKILSLDECIVYYMIDCWLWIFLLPYRIMIWMFPQLSELEDLARDTLELLDGIVYDTSSGLRGKDENGKPRAGFHINQWPNGIMNKCYRCKPKDEVVKQGLFLKELEEFFNDDGTNFFKFLFRCTLIIFGAITIGIYIYRSFKRKNCSQMK